MGILDEKKIEDLKKNSYSSIEVFCNCPMRYDLTYNQGYRSNKVTLALGLGSIAHKCLELAVLTKINKAKYTYDELVDIFYNGWQDLEGNSEEKDSELLGVNELKETFFDDFCEISNSYSVKTVVFKEILKKELEKNEDEWQPYATEKYFTVNYKNKCLFHGFIDRVDINKNGELRVVDYKTSKKIYDNDKLNNSKQMGVYKLACKELYGKEPIEYVYHFVFLDEKQNALEGEYKNKIDKVLDKTLEEIQSCNNSSEWKPKPSPLCYWCPYTGSSPLADEGFVGMCPYYSLWTPMNKTYKTNRKYGGRDINKIEDLGW